MNGASQKEYSIELRWQWLAQVVCLACFLFSGVAHGAQDQVALILHEQGRAAIARADYAQAERLFGEALAIWRSLGPPYEGHAASTLVNMGEALSQAGKRHESITALEQALLLNRSSLGPKHTRTVFTLNSLGHAYQFVNELERSEAVFAEALAIERELYPNDALVGQTLLGISLLRRRQERFDEALQVGEASLRALLQARGEASTEAAVAYENVAALHLLSGRPVRAIPLFRKARFMYEKALGASSPVLASVISQEGLALLEDGQMRQAEITMTKAIGLLAGTGPSGEYRLAVAEMNLGLLRLRQRKLVESERLLTHALKVQDQMPTPPTYSLAAAMRALAQLRKVQRRDIESAELMARAARIHAAP